MAEWLFGLSRAFVIHVYPFFVILSFLVFFSFIALNFDEIRGKIKIGRKALLILALLLLAGLVLRIAILTPNIGMFSSSWEHNLAAKEFASTGALFNCGKGTFSECQGIMLLTHPGGYTVILSMFLLAGGSLEQMLLVQAIASVLTAFVLFFLIFALTEKAFPSLIGSSVFLFLEISYYCAPIADCAVSVFNNLFIALMLFFLFYACKNKTRKARSLALLSIGVLAFFLIENILAIALAFFAILLFWKYNLKKLKENPFSLFFLAFMVSTLLVFVYRDWVYAGLFTSLFAPENFLGNLDWLFLMWTLHFAPYIYFFPLALGLMLLSKETRKHSIFFGLWFLLFNLLFLFFELGPAPRYLQITLIPFSVICGIGAWIAVQKITERIKVRHASAVLALFFLLAAFYPATMAQKTVFRFNTSQELFEAMDLIDDPEKRIIFPSINTAWEAIYGREETFSLPMVFLTADDFNKNLYFIDTGRCDQPRWSQWVRSDCEVMRENSERFFEYRGLTVYKVKKDEKSREDILRHFSTPEANKVYRLYEP